MVSRNQDSNEVLDALKQITASKAPKKKSVLPDIGRPVVRESFLTENLLNQLDSNPYRKPGTFFPKTKTSSTDQELFDTLSTIREGQGPLGFLTAIDTGRRATISTIREVVDALDFKDETRASFSDWKKQTTDVTFGYGRAFPITSSNVVGRWAGRSTGLIGDLLFDPINWATFGGAIPAKAVIKFVAKDFAEMQAKGTAKKFIVKKTLENGDVLVSARSVLGKNVIGRDGRASLGRFTKKRLTALRNSGEEGYKNLTDDMITEISGKIYADGKREFFRNPNIPEGFAESIGVRGPGIYYFGSRLKVPGTTEIARLGEDALTDLRLYLSTTGVGKALRTSTTGRGVGRIMRMGEKGGVDKKTGEDIILNPLVRARVNLADGSLLSPLEINKAMAVMEMHDFARLRRVVHVESETNNMSPLADELADIENGHRYLDNVSTATLEAGAASGDPGFVAALKMRQYMDYLYERANARSKAIGGTEIPRNDGYFPHMETEQAKQDRLLKGNDAFDAMLYGDEEVLARNAIPYSDRRTVFNERQLAEGDKWFGTTLKKSDLTADRLNEIAIASGKVNFNMFETNTTKVFAEYLQQFSDQMSWYDALEYATKEFPDFLSFGEILMKISPSYADEVMKKRPNQMFKALEQAIRKHSLFLDNSLTSVRNELISKHGSFEAALIAMREGTMSATEVDSLLKALNEQIVIADGLDQQYKQMLADISAQVENRDGISGFTLFFEGTRSVQASQKFEQLKFLLKEITGYGDDVTTPGPAMVEGQDKMAKVKELFDTYGEYTEAIEVLSRDIEFSSLVSDVFPGLNNIGQYGAAQQYDIFAKIIDMLGEPNPNMSARMFSRRWSPKTPFEYKLRENGGWPQEVVDAVSRMTIDDVRSFLDDVRLMDAEQLAALGDDVMKSGRGNKVARWLQALIVENERLLGGGEELVRGFMDDFRTWQDMQIGKKMKPYDFSIVDTTNPDGSFNQWKSAIKRLLVGDVTAFEDLLIQQSAISTIYRWQEMYAPFGIQIGDDVIDEIVQREARDYALNALRNNDQKRFAYLTSAKFGRDGGTGPLGTHRLIERQRQIFEDMMNLHGFDVRTGTFPDGAPLPVAVKKVSGSQSPRVEMFIKNLSEEQRSQWARVSTENKQVIDYVDNRIKFLKNERNNMQSGGELQVRWDSISERFDKALESIQSGELFNIVDDSAPGRRKLNQSSGGSILDNAGADSVPGGQILFDDLIEEIHEIAEQIGDAARLSQDPIAAKTIEDNWNGFVDEMVVQIERTKFILQNYSPESEIYKQQKFQIRMIISNSMLKEFEASRTIFFNNFDSIIDSMSEEMLHLVRMRRKASYVLSNPEDYFRTGPGSLDAGNVDEAIFAAPRSLDEGGRVVDTETGELVPPTEQELDVIIANYRNSDQMSIARATENNANYAHRLVHVDLSKMPADQMPGGITFTTSEWDRIVHGGFVETGSPKFDAFLSALRIQRAGVSDDVLIDGFVDFVLTNFRNTDAVVKHNKVIAYRRKQILANWKKSEHYSWLEEYRTYEQRKFAKAFVDNASDGVRQLDAASNAITYVRQAAAEAVVDVPSFTLARRELLIKAFDDFVKTVDEAQKTVSTKETKVALVEEASPSFDKSFNPAARDAVDDIDDSVERVINDVLGPDPESRSRGAGVGRTESRTFIGAKGEGMEVADFEALPITGISGSDEVLLLRNRENAKVVDSFLKGSNVEKSTQQLEREIRILETLIKNKIDTPWTTGKSKRVLVRLRKAELAKREGFVVTPAGSRPQAKWTNSQLPIDDFENAIEFVKRIIREEKLVMANAKHVERLMAYIKRAANKTRYSMTPELETAVTAVMGSPETQTDKMVAQIGIFIKKSLKKRNGKYNRSLVVTPEDVDYHMSKINEPDFDYEIAEAVEIDELRRASTLMLKKLPETEMVPVPKGVAPVATDVPMDAAARLQAELESLGRSSTTDVDRLGKDAAEARSVADRLQAKYDLGVASNQAVDEDQIKYLQNRIEVLQRLVDGSQIEVRAGRGKQSTFDYSDGTSFEYTKHQEAKKFLEYANSVLSLLGAKSNGDFDSLDAILRAQIASEAEVHLAVAGMKSAQHDRLILEGVQKMIDDGGRLLPDGRVQMSNGLIVDGVSVDAVVEAGKGIRAGWDSISKNFPELYGSPEMVELLSNAARFEDPEFIRKMAYYIGPYTKLFKAFAVLSPGFHVRNGLGNAIQLALAGVEMDNAIQGTKMFKRWMDASKQGKSWNEFIVTLDPDMQEIMKTARNGSIGSGGGIYTEVMKEASGNRIMDWWIVRKNYSFGQASDNYSRFVLSFDSAMKGNDQFMAAARVKRFYFDYEDLSTVDKFMKQIMPFWLFYSRNMHTQITNMWLNPRPYNIYYNIQRNIEDNETPNPPFVEQLGGFRLPFGDGLYAMPDFGFTRINKELSDLANPIRMVPKLNPLFVVPFEQATGRDSYSGRKFTDVEDRLLNALTGIAPPAQQAEKLILNDNPMSQLNAWLGYLGSPVRKYN